MAPFEVPCAAYFGYPRTSVMSVLKTRVVSSMVQLRGGELEKANPGRDGMTTWNDTGLPEEVEAGLFSGSIMGRNSIKDPGQP